MNEPHSRQENIFEIKFPDDLYGEVIDGIDLTMLGLDSLRLIDAYAKQGGELSEIQRRVLKECESDLAIVVPQVSDHQEYFQKLQEAVRDVIQKIGPGGSY